MNHFRQLIPGNPGSSYLAAILYLMRDSIYQEPSDYKTQQLNFYLKGYEKPSPFFFQGPLAVLALHHKKKIKVFVNSKKQTAIMKAANDGAIRVLYHPLNNTGVQHLLSKYGQLVCSVDLYYFNRLYHDYHFCALEKDGNKIRVFDPHSGKSMLINRLELANLTNSVRINLNDINICFCLEN